MKRKIRLTESQLHRVIKESVKKVLRETSDNLINRAWDKADDEAFECSCESPNWFTPPSDKEKKRRRQAQSFKDELMRRRQEKLKSGKVECYYLPTDSYGQPSGQIETLIISPEELDKRRENGDYIFDNYVDAIERAND